MIGLMKVSYGGLAMWRRWRGIRLPRESMPWKRGIDTMKECLRKRGLDVRQARRMFQDRCEWQGFGRGNAWGEMPQLYEACEVWESVGG